jgi:hypothetical protein
MPEKTQAIKTSHKPYSRRIIEGQITIAHPYYWQPINVTIICCSSRAYEMSILFGIHCHDKRYSIENMKMIKENQDDIEGINISEVKTKDYRLCLPWAVSVKKDNMKYIDPIETRIRLLILYAEPLFFARSATKCLSSL